MREDRRFDILWRIWPGTQRLLLWADPVFAAGYARAFQFCGSSGVEIMEPLSFKGRRGSGRHPRAGGRCAYADASLRPRWDWEKYLDTYRVWGRKLYNPDATGRDVEPALRRRQPHSADRHHRAHALGREQQLLARDLHQPVARRAVENRIYRHPRTQDLRQHQPARPAALLPHQRFRRRVAQGRAQRQVFAHRGRPMAGRSGRRRAAGKRPSPRCTSMSRFRPVWAASSPPNSAPAFCMRFTSARATAPPSKKRSSPTAPRAPPGPDWPKGQGRLRPGHHRRRTPLAPRPLARPPARH